MEKVCFDTSVNNKKEEYEKIIEIDYATGNLLYYEYFSKH